MREDFTGMVVDPGSLNDGRMKTMGAPQMRMMEREPDIAAMPLEITQPFPTLIKTTEYRYTVLMHQHNQHAFWIPVDHDNVWLMEQLVKGYRK